MIHLLLCNNVHVYSLTPSNKVYPVQSILREYHLGVARSMLFSTLVTKV